MRKAKWADLLPPLESFPHRRGLAEFLPPFCMSAFKHFFKKPFSRMGQTFVITISAPKPEGAGLLA